MSPHTLLSLLSLLGVLPLLLNAANTTGVLSITPSLYWDGIDGSWSTFQIQIGTPGQTVRLLPGTSANAGNAFWSIIDAGCSDAVAPNVTDCASSRGNIFESNASSTWSTQKLANGGLFALDTYEENFLGLSGNGMYGFDTVQLGLPGSGLPMLQGQLVAGIAAPDFWLGSLPLSPYPHNFTNMNSPFPSMLSTLRNESLIGSLSWGYTAGAAYRDPPVFGSLTLGGVDKARYNESAALENVTFGPDFSRDLLVGLQSITYDTLGSSPLLSQGIYAFIDSMVATMWLPIPVCQQFEKAFNLTWNDTAEAYLLTGAQHAALEAQNPTFTFKLSSSADSTTGAETVDIDLSYAAFDLNISQPLADQESFYFPLKQAQNDTQYTLGRVFLQEAYVVTDYDRRHFSIGQATTPSTSNSQDLQAIGPPRSETGSSTEAQPARTSGISTGAIAGIVVVAIALLISAIGGYLFYRRQQKQRRTTVAARYADDKGDQHSSNSNTPLAEAGTDAGVHEASGHEMQRMELDAGNKFGDYKFGQNGPVEADSMHKVVEMDGGSDVAEMEAKMAPVEMETPMEPVELEAPR